MDLDAINSFLDSNYIGAIRRYAEDEAVVDAWQRIVERLLFNMYNDGQPLPDREKWELYREALEDIAQYDFAIYTEECDELCKIFANIGRLACLRPANELSIEAWIDQHRPW